MPYTGNLVRINQSSDQRKLPSPSPRHAVDEEDPSLPRGEHHVASGTGAEFAGTTYAPVVMSGFGMPLDDPSSWAGDPPGGGSETPYRITYPRGNPHASDAVLSARAGYAQWFAHPVRDRAHDGDTDRGWLRTTFSPEPMFMDTQNPRGEIDTQGLTTPYDEATDDRFRKHVRGINSLPENNPDRVGYLNGFRPGRERVRVWGSDVFASISRVQGVQQLQPRDAYTPLHYPRMIGSMTTPPALPRTAGNPDDTAMSATNYASSPGSVFGGF